ncbi:MAG: twin-arginine translocase TatA/TatE family subunit [Methanocellales archaeon]|nr:twin-arginine translocase TatA/TatE family subunit [Methanocellales archaeon]
MIGTTELLIILAVAAFLFGSSKLPGIAKDMGKAIGEFNRAKKEFESEILSSIQQEQKPEAKSDDIEENIKDEAIKRISSRFKSKVFR